MQLQHFVLTFLLVAVSVLLVNAQNGSYPPRLNIPGAAPVGGPPRAQFRNDKVVRVRRPVALRAQQNTLVPASAPRIIEEPKPVTEAPEEEDNLPDAFLPQLLREQQLAQTQQAQFQQAAAAFLGGGEPNSIQDLHSALQEQEPLVQSARFPDRERPQPQAAPAPSSRPAFNDYGIGSNIGANAQRFGNERPQPSQPAPAPQRVNVIRTRPARPQFEQQAAAAPPPPQQAAQPARSRPKPIQARPRPAVDENQLQHSDDREAQYSSAQRRQRPVSQTLRKWRDENEDGSITWGYENDDGSFKEEFIGTDCITKGTYGYIDPDGNKREYHYETGIKCDPNRRENEEDLQDNGFINYEENKAVLPNGIEIDMSQLGKRKSKRPSAVYRN